MSKNLTPRDGIKVIAKALQPSEYQIHKAFVQYVRKTHPNVAHLLIHIPNEGKRSHKGVSAQKALGFRTGCFDIFFAKPKYFDLSEVLGTGRIRYCGLWIEFKSEEGRISGSQIEFMSDMMSYGYWAVVINNLDEAIKVFEDYLK